MIFFLIFEPLNPKIWCRHLCMDLYSYLADILPEMIEYGPLCIADLFQNKFVAYF